MPAARDGRGRFDAVPWWRPQAYYDEPGRGTDGTRRRRRAADPGDPHARPVPLARARRPRRRGPGANDGAAPHGDRGLRRARCSNSGTAHRQLAATTAAYPGRPEQIEIIGTKGTALLDRRSLRVALLDGHEEFVSTEGTGSGAKIMDFPNDAHRALLADFFDAIERTRPRVTGEDALASQRLVADILEKRPRDRVPGDLSIAAPAERLTVQSAVS